MAKRKLGADLTDQTIDRFNAYCDAKGYAKNKLATAALKLIELVPADVREMSLEGQEKRLLRWFEEAEEKMTQADVIEQVIQRLEELHGASRPKTGNAKTG